LKVSTFTGYDEAMEEMLGKAHDPSSPELTGHRQWLEILFIARPLIYGKYQFDLPELSPDDIKV